MAKRVCIIGAGPSGIAAAKTLIYDHPGVFRVTIFEQSERIGGLWPVSEQDEGMINPNMRVNQSRHTVSFSDLAWPASASAFPKAWEIGQYLQRHIKTYPGYDIRTSSKVIKARYGKHGAWTVHVQDIKASAEPKILEYDHVIIASGFFSKPKQLPTALQKSGRVSHSSRYRDVPQLLKESSSKSTDRNIVVVGSQMSGVEVAASIALQLSSDANTPGKERTGPPYTITHVMQRPFWIMPLFFPYDPFIDEHGPSDIIVKKNNPAPTFLPLDLVSYNLQTRPEGPLTNTSGHITEQVALGTHNFMQQYLGGDQSDLGPAFTISGEVKSKPPMLAISDNYVEFVRSGDIKVTNGKVTRQPEGQENSFIVEQDGVESIIPDVAAVVFATGFEIAPSLDFLSDDLLRTLQFDPAGDEFPLALNVHSVVSSKVPSLGFVGFYRSPYWAVIQMQARFLGNLWSGDVKAEKVLEEDKTMDTMLALRKDPRRAQFPMGDYAFLMEDFSNILGIKRFEPKDRTARTGLVSPARYAYNTEPGSTENKETELALNLFYETFDNSKAGTFVARAVARSLQGSWNIDRRITSHNASYPSGKLTGIARFLPRFPLRDDSPCDLEYLYSEKGDFVTDTGLNFTANRSYVYRYSEATDKLTAWFVKEDTSVDYFFHEMEFSKGEEGWLATSKHWCSPDQYDVEYEFKFKGTNLTEWSQTYQVKGPNKDYTLKSRFTR